MKNRYTEKRTIKTVVTFKPKGFLKTLMNLFRIKLPKETVEIVVHYNDTDNFRADIISDNKSDDNFDLKIVKIG